MERNSGPGSSSQLPLHHASQSQHQTNAQNGGASNDSSQRMVVFSVSFYLVAAIVMIMVNKWVLNSVEIPIFFLVCQLMIAVALLHIFAVLGYFKLPKVDRKTCWNLRDLTACNTLGLAFNTYCLQYVDASFYQVARGLVLPITVGMSWFVLNQKSSLPTLAAVGCVCIGFMLGVSTDRVNVSALGVLLGVLSSTTTAFHAVVVKRALPAVGNSTFDLSYYSNLLSAIALSPFVFVTGEYRVVLNMVFNDWPQFKTFLVGVAVTGIFGFLIGIAAFLSIKVTSPVTHMISAAVRGVLQTFLGMWLFNDKVGRGRAAGIIFILGGSVFYVYTKSLEQRSPPPPTAHLPLRTEGAQHIKMDAEKGEE